MILFHYSLSDTKEHNGSQKLLSKVVFPLDDLFYSNKTKLFTLNLGIFNIESFLFSKGTTPLTKQEALGSSQLRKKKTEIIPSVSKKVPP